MKKLLIVLVPLIFASTVFAAQNAGTTSQGANANQSVTTNAQSGTGQREITPTRMATTTGNRVQNEVQTQNQGTETQLQVETKEELGSGSGEGLQVRSQEAIQNMSEVAKQVQQMLQIKTSGGIGDQVREVARTQTIAQQQIQSNLEKIDKKNTMLKVLFGPDYGAIKNINQLIEENNVRIQELQALLEQVTNYADQIQIQATIQTIVNQNTALQERIQEEEKIGSLFGWLIRFFAK